MKNNTERLGSTMTYDAVDKRLGHERGVGSVRVLSDSLLAFTELTDDGESQFDSMYGRLVGYAEHDSSSIQERMSRIEERIDDGFGDDIVQLLELQDSLRFLKDANREVSACATRPKTSDLRRQLVAKSYAEYVENRDFYWGEWGDNVDATTDFLLFYKRKVLEDIRQHRWSEKITNWRDQYADFIASPAAHNLIDEAGVPRAAGAVKTVPIVIVDPITSLINKDRRHDESEYWRI